MVKRLPQRSMANPPATVPSGLTPGCRLAVEKIRFSTISVACVVNVDISRSVKVLRWCNSYSVPNFVWAALIYVYS
jgi:hypothetical protein